MHWSNARSACAPVSTNSLVEHTCITAANSTDIPPVSHHTTNNKGKPVEVTIYVYGTNYFRETAAVLSISVCIILMHDILAA